jgi:hypothetical protein
MKQTQLNLATHKVVGRSIPGPAGKEYQTGEYVDATYWRPEAVRLYESERRLQRIASDPALEPARARARAEIKLADLEADFLVERGQAEAITSRHETAAQAKAASDAAMEARPAVLREAVEAERAAQRHVARLRELDEGIRVLRAGLARSETA